MRPREKTSWQVLVPFDPREGIDVSVAAERAGKSSGTLRNWCNQYGLGRRIASGVWVVSKVALAMFLDGDAEALKAYLAGDRSSPEVKFYFDRCGVPIPKIKPRNLNNSADVIRVRVAPLS
jgi:hypothetical protein